MTMPKKYQVLASLVVPYFNLSSLVPAVCL